MTEGSDLLSGQRILVVEDDKDLRDLTAEYFEDFGACVDQAENGVDALERMKQQNQEFDVIISDLRMPKMGGRELLEKIRETESAPPLFIIVSGFGDLESSDAKRLGASALFHKPTPWHEVVDLIKSHLPGHDPSDR